VKISFINNKIPLAIAGFVGACIIMFLTSHWGAGTSPDSVYYISVARNVAGGKGFVGYDGYYYVLQPPLYPLLLAAIKKIFLVDPLVSAGYLNAILLGSVVYCSGLFLLKHLKSLSLVIMGTLSVLISFALIEISLIALSEPLFILFVLLYLNYFDIYIEKKNLASLLIFSSAAALACLTRYMGVILILTGSIGIFVWGRKTFEGRFKHLIYFLLITILPSGLWILRNYFLSGTFTGHRAGSSYTLSQNIIFFFNTFLKWYLPIQLNGLQLFFFTLLVFSGFVGAIILIKRLNHDASRMKQMFPVLIFIFFYSVIIVISSTTTAYDKIGNRLLSPLFAPSIFIMFIILDNILEWLTKHLRRRIVNILFLICLIGWMQYPLAQTTFNVQYYIKQSGWEFSSRKWRDNSVIEYLNNHKQFESGYSFYSNVPEAVYILADKETKWSPAKTFYNSPKLINENSSFKSIRDRKNKVCLVWFKNNNRKFLYSINELQKGINLVKVVQLKDSEIYIIEK